MQVCPSRPTRRPGCCGNVIVDFTGRSGPSLDPTDAWRRDLGGRLGVDPGVARPSSRSRCPGSAARTRRSSRRSLMARDVGVEHGATSAVAGCVMPGVAPRRPRCRGRRRRRRRGRGGAGVGVGGGDVPAGRGRRPSSTNVVTSPTTTPARPRRQPTSSHRRRRRGTAARVGGGDDPAAPDPRSVGRVPVVRPGSSTAAGPRSVEGRRSAAGRPVAAARPDRRPGRAGWTRPGPVPARPRRRPAQSCGTYRGRVSWTVVARLGLVAEAHPAVQRSGRAPGGVVRGAARPRSRPGSPAGRSRAGRPAAAPRRRPPRRVPVAGHFAINRSTRHRGSRHPVQRAGRAPARGRSARSSTTISSPGSRANADPRRAARRAWRRARTRSVATVAVAVQSRSGARVGDAGPHPAVRGHGDPGQPGDAEVGRASARRSGTPARWPA